MGECAMAEVREGERVQFAGVVAVARRPGAAAQPLAGLLHLIDPSASVALVELDAALGGQVLVVPLALLEPEAGATDTSVTSPATFSPAEGRRLQFARWLVEQGRLSG
jgi:hypothetical protein